MRGGGGVRDGPDQGRVHANVKTKKGKKRRITEFAVTPTHGSF